MQPNQYQQPPQYAPGPPPQYQPAPPVQYQQPTPAGPQGGPGRYAKPEAAAQGDRVTATALHGHLLLVVAVGVHPEFFPARAEVLGPDGKVKEAAKPASDATEVNVVDLDAPGADGQPGKTWIGVMWGGKVLAGGLARQIGVEVLGRMGKGVARGSNAAPFVLDDESDNPQSCGRADEFLNRRPNWQLELGTDSALSAPAAQPAPVQYQQPVYQPAPQYAPAPAQQYQQPAPQYAPAGQPGQYAPQGYQPQQYQQPAPQGAYQPGVSGPGSPEAQQAYANLAQQQAPQQYQLYPQ